MAVTLEVMSNDLAEREKRKVAAVRVKNSTEVDGKLPDLKLLAFLDDGDDPDVKRDYGRARGISGPIRANSPTMKWLVDPILGMPRRLRDDYGIYLHGSTCADEIALTMTFAHELQHFVQYEFKRKLWAVSRLIRELAMETQVKERLNWPDIPHEREARIVAKRVGVNLLGDDRVRDYIALRISENVSVEDVEDWRFSLDVDPSAPYDLTTETGRVLRRLTPFRNELEYVLQTMKSKFPGDYKDVDLSAYFDVSPEHPDLS